MKRLFTFIVSLSVLVMASPLAALGDDTNEETQLIGVLQSDHPLQEKDAACARLKWIGTARSVPVLAELLTDEQLSQTACYALESMKGPEAGDALRQALAKTSGSNQIGVIHSLGVRGETKAVPDLAKLLSGPDPEVAVAAAGALGHTGGPEALQALQSAWDGTTAGAVHDAVNDGLLDCANRLLTSGKLEQASKVFQKLYDHEKNDGVRQGAFRGLILSSEKRGIVLMVQAIKGDDGPSQGAALQLASKVGGPATTRALAALLSNLPAPVQIALLQALAQRGDRYAVPSVEEMVKNPDPDVRLAAITTLGDLRDGRAALLLAHTAAESTGAERTAARQSLLDLRYGPITAKLLDGLTGATPELQSELVRALGDRGDSSAAPKLLELAQGQNDSTRSAALQALALLAGPAQVRGLVQIVVSATNDDARSEAADALGSACQHIESQNGRVDASALVQAVQNGPLESRMALLGVCSGVSDPQVREVLRAAVKSPEPGLRGAALRALCNSQDEQLLPDILQVALTAPEENFRMLAIRGCVRLITDEQAASLPVAQKIDALKSILNSTLNTEGKRLILSALVSIPDIQTLDMATALLDDAEVKVEAADATVQIAKAVSGQHPAEAVAALKRVIATPANADIRKLAQAVLKKIKPAK